MQEDHYRICTSGFKITFKTDLNDLICLHHRDASVGLDSGASAKGNHSIGMSTVGGMLTGVVFGVFIIPVMFVIFQYLHEKMPSRKKKRLQRQKLEQELLSRLINI
jgi:hypothetical protein